MTGVDISDVAITRAKALNLPYARFETEDCLRTPFEGFDVITAIECLYELSSEEQEQFFAKVAREHAHKLLILCGPIIGEDQHRRYFTHAGLLETFRRHGFSLIDCGNLYVYRIGVLRTLAAALVRLPFCPWSIDWLPESFVYQRFYAIVKA